MGAIEYRRDDARDIIAKAKRFIEEFFADDFSGHDYYHALRVYKMANRIAEREGGDLEIISLAALLHNVDDYKIVGQGNEPCRNARDFLEGEKYPEEQIDRICEIIENISFSDSNGGAREKTLEGKIVQDADRLDGMGAIGIARTFAYGGAHRRPMYLPGSVPRENMSVEEYREGSLDSVSHFYEKILKLKDLMNTETAKKEAEYRHAYIVQYLDEFFREWKGGFKVRLG